MANLGCMYTWLAESEGCIAALCGIHKQTKTSVYFAVAVAAATATAAATTAAATTAHTPAVVGGGFPNAATPGSPQCCCCCCCCCWSTSMDPFPSCSFNPWLQQPAAAAPVAVAAQCCAMLLQSWVRSWDPLGDKHVGSAVAASPAAAASAAACCKRWTHRLRCVSFPVTAAAAAGAASLSIAAAAAAVRGLKLQ